MMLIEPPGLFSSLAAWRAYLARLEQHASTDPDLDLAVERARAIIAMKKSEEEAGSHAVDA